MGFWDCRYLNVPMNEKGVLELDRTSDDNRPNVFSIQLTKEDIANIDNLVNDFNSTFGIIIDFAEDERLLNGNLLPALVLAKKRLETSPKETKRSIQKILDAINKAIEFNTFVEFDL